MFDLHSLHQLLILSTKREEEIEEVRSCSLAYGGESTMRRRKENEGEGKSDLARIRFLPCA